MRIAFATTQSPHGSTLIGRVLPLATYAARQHDVTILALAGAKAKPEKLDGVTIISVGAEPFQRTPNGKNHQRGGRRAVIMLDAAIRTASALRQQQPDVIIVAKVLPHNVFGVWLYAAVLGGRARIIVDADDFELTANTITSLWQRAAIHWAERTAVRLANHIVTATPFLTDHFEQLARGKKKVTTIPTGVEFMENPAGDGAGAPQRAHSFLSEHPLGVQRRQDPPVVTILYLGSVSISSGHRVDLLPGILAAVRQHIPDARMVIAGSGDDSKKLKGEFAAHNVAAAVTWHGRFTASDVPMLLRQAAVLIDPVDASITNRAKSSYRTALAAAAGMPIVTSDIGIRPYLLPDALHERCFATPTDEKSYADKICAFLQQPLAPTEQTLLRQHARENTSEVRYRQYSKLLSP